MALAFQRWYNMRIAIVDVIGSPYDGSTPSKRGLGGSESAVVFIAHELKKLGMTVHVYNDCEGLDARPGNYDGVEYRPRDAIILQSFAYDVVISSRSVRGITEHYWRDAYKVLWLHDTFCDGDDQVEALVTQNKIDEIWTLSDWHTTYVSQCNHGHRRMMEVLKRKIWVTRNGVNLYQDAPSVDLKEYDHFIFNAAVSKGMETLLEDIWPRVRENIPEAKLTIIGGAYPLKESDVQNDKLRELTQKHGGKNGVLFTGIIRQDEVADWLVRAGWMIYPQSFPETFGISTVESLAYGTPVITGRFGAMEETAIEDGCYLMDYPVDSNVLYTFNKDVHVNTFVNLVLEAHSKPYLWEQKCNGALKVREVCTWDKVALQWKQHMFKKTGHYLPVEDYHEVQRINHRTHEIFNKRWSNPEEWAYYPEIEKKIHVIVPFFNACQYLSKCIESIRTQNYENFEVHLIDDDSTDSSAAICSFATDGDHRFHYHSNNDNVGALANQVMCLTEIIDAAEDDIIILLDGDDALVNDPNIFKKINRLYHGGAEFTYGSCWSMVDNIPLVAQEYPKHIVESRAFRNYQFPWRIPYTHLRTFKYGLFDCIDLTDLRDDNGHYFKASGDTALFYSLIEQCQPEGIKVVRDIFVLYNDAHPNNDYKVNNIEQIKNQDTIMSRGNKPPIMKKKKILIAIPTDRNIHPQTFKSIYDLDIPDDCEITFQFFHGYRVDQVRNLIADWGVQWFNYVFCVDYDISFAPDTLTKMLSHDKPLVTGLYIQRIPGQHNLELYRVTPDESHVRLTMNDLVSSLEPIDGCGFGCVLIKTEVFKAVGYPQFEYHPALRMEDTLSEDVDFCNKVRKLGFDMWADTTIKCGHHGQTVFEV